jgi:putative oxidoreductase
MSTQELKGTPSSSSFLTYTDRIAEQWQDFLLLVARVLMGWIFVSSGWRKLMDVPGFVKTMPRRDLPEFLGYVAPPVEFIGGIFLLLGFATRYTALLMLLFVIIASFSSHRYWNFTDPAQYSNQSSHFWKNVSIKGGLILLFITGAGRLALDRMLMKR